MPLFSFYGEENWVTTLVKYFSGAFQHISSTAENRMHESEILDSRLTLQRKETIIWILGGSRLEPQDGMCFLESPELGVSRNGTVEPGWRAGPALPQLQQHTWAINSTSQHQAAGG